MGFRGSTLFNFKYWKTSFYGILHIVSKHYCAKSKFLYILNSLTYSLFILESFAFISLSNPEFCSFENNQLFKIAYLWYTLSLSLMKFVKIVNRENLYVILGLNNIIYSTTLFDFTFTDNSIAKICLLMFNKTNNNRLNNFVIF